MTDKLMDEIKRAAVGDGKYAGLPSHVYSLFGDTLAKLDEVAALEQRAEKWELEAKRLYGVGQDIEEMRVALEAKLSKMEEALDDIAKGMASIPDAILEEGRPAVTSFMWTYSQKRAKEALTGGDDV